MTTEPTTSSAPLRADAARNRARLLEVAAHGFAEDGIDVALEEIARRAEVGIGTLYRHFPSRAALVEAVYRNELERLDETVDGLLAEHASSGADALTAWLTHYLDYAATKRGMGEALKSLMTAAPELRGQAMGATQRGLDLIVEAGIADGTLRPETRADDAKIMLYAIFQIPHEPGWTDQARRLLTVYVDGLRTTR